MWTCVAIPVGAILICGAMLAVILYGDALARRIRRLEDEKADAGLLMRAYTRAIRYPLIWQPRKVEFLEKRGGLHRSQGNLGLAYQDYADAASNARESAPRLHLAAAEVSVASNDQIAALRHLSLIKNGSTDEHAAAAKLGETLKDAETVVRHASAVLSAPRRPDGHVDKTYVKALRLRAHYQVKTNPAAAAQDYETLAQLRDAEPEKRIKACSWLIDRAEALKDSTMSRGYIGLLADIPPPIDSKAIDAWTPYFDRFVWQSIAGGNGQDVYSRLREILRNLANSELSRLSPSTRRHLGCMLAESAVAADDVPTAIQAVRFAQFQSGTDFDERIRAIVSRTDADARSPIRRVIRVASNGAAEVHEECPANDLFVLWLKPPHGIIPKVLDLCQQAWLHSIKSERASSLDSYSKAVALADQAVSQGTNSPLRWIAKHMRIAGFPNESVALEQREVAARPINEQLSGCPKELVLVCREAVVHARAGRHKAARTTYDKGIAAIQEIPGLDGRIGALMWLMEHLTPDFPHEAEKCFVTAHRVAGSLSHTIPKLKLYCLILSQAKNVGIGNILTQYRSLLEEATQLAQELCSKALGYLKRDRDQAQRAWSSLYNNDPASAYGHLKPEGRSYGGPWGSS